MHCYGSEIKQREHETPSLIWLYTYVQLGEAGCDSCYQEARSDNEMCLDGEEECFRWIWSEKKQSFKDHIIPLFSHLCLDFQSPQLIALLELREYIATMVYCLNST